MAGVWNRIGDVVDVLVGHAFEVFQQKAVNEDVTAANFAQQNALVAVVKKAGVVEQM
jgi:hypothetical protein